MIDFDKLRSAVVGFWNFIWPALTTAFLWCGLTYWLAPETSQKVAAALKPFLKLPDQHTRETLTFFGIDKLVPLLTAFLTLLIIYLVGLLSEKIGDFIPPYVIYGTTDLAAKLAGNVLGPRLKAHFHANSDQEMWDSANEFASGIDPQKSIAGMNLQGSKKREWAARESWNRSKFFVLWVLFITTVEIHVAGFHRTQRGRSIIAILALLIISFLYFLKLLSTWKNSVGATLNAAKIVVVETPELREKIATLPRPDNPGKANPVFRLAWGPRFLLVMEPELFFDVERFPLLRVLLGVRQKNTTFHRRDDSDA